MDAIRKGYPGLFDRASDATKGGMMDELARLRRQASETEAQRLRAIQQEQEAILGPEQGGPSLDQDVLQYYRSLGLPDELIFRELGIGAQR